MCKQVMCLCANKILLKKKKWWTRIGLAGHSWPTTALNCLQINLLLLLDWKTPMLELSLICTSAKPQILHISYRTCGSVSILMSSLWKSSAQPRQEYSGSVALLVLFLQPYGHCYFLRQSCHPLGLKGFKVVSLKTNVVGVKFTLYKSEELMFQISHFC